MNAFLIESAAVGSIVTIAVITASIYGQPMDWQMSALKKTAMPVLIIRSPKKLNFFMLIIIHTFFKTVSNLIIRHIKVIGKPVLKTSFKKTNKYTIIRLNI